MTEIKVEDLFETYGVFNDISIGDNSPSADRRTLTTTDALSEVLEAYYTPDVLAGKSVYEGIVLASIPSTVPQIQSTEQHIKYLADNSGDDVEKQYYAYKVLVPEVDPRPIEINKALSDASLTTTQRIMTLPTAIIDVGNAEAPEASTKIIQPGTYVKIIYKNQQKLKNPKIVGIGRKIITMPGEKHNTSLRQRFTFNSHTAQPGTSSPISSYGGKPYPGDFTPANGDELAYDLPIKGTTPLLVASPYADRINPITNSPQRHKGLDIAKEEGAELVALENGEVRFANDEMSDSAGWYVVIKYEDKINGGDLYSRYLHMKDKALFKTGDRVSRGDVVGYVGNTGNSTGAHLHWELGSKSRGGGKILRERFNPIAYYPEGTFTDKSTGKALVLESHPDSGAV